MDRVSRFSFPSAFCVAMAMLLSTGTSAQAQYPPEAVYTPMPAYGAGSPSMYPVGLPPGMYPAEAGPVMYPAGAGPVMYPAGAPSVMAGPAVAGPGQVVAGPGGPGVVRTSGYQPRLVPYYEDSLLNIFRTDPVDVFYGSVHALTTLASTTNLDNLAFPDNDNLTLAGWTQLSYTTRSTGLFNTDPRHVNFQQVWLYLEKVADGSEGLDWGGRVDLMYGTDGGNTQAFGNAPGRWDYQNGFDHGIYAWAVPQMYAELAYGDLSVKAGHFFSILGYEMVMAPQNFFYSHSFSFNFNRPLTNSGVLAHWKGMEEIQMWGGWTSGWNTAFDRFNDGDHSDGSNYLGAISMRLTNEVSFIYGITAGDLGTRGEGFSHSFVMNVALDDDWEYVFQSNLVETNTGPGNHSVSLNNYLFYTINEQLKAGLRGEWWNVSGRDMFEVTGGVNIRPSKNFVVRPELRWQGAGSRGQDVFFTNTFGVPASQLMFGIDAILTY